MTGHFESPFGMEHGFLKLEALVDGALKLLLILNEIECGIAHLPILHQINALGVLVETAELVVVLLVLHLV